MANVSRHYVMRLSGFAILLLIVPATSWAKRLPPIAEQMAETYGLDAFGQIEAIRYTFNAGRPGAVHSRTWEWNPKTDMVSYAGKDKEGKAIKVTYQRSQLGRQSDTVKNEIDPAFINDQYWLLLPLHVVWDRNATVTDEGTHKLPLANAAARLVVVKYPSQGGYAPGDTWELYLGGDKRIEEMVYRRGGSGPPKLLIATWTGYKKAGPLLVSTEHRGTADGKPVQVFFSNVSVKVTGSETWMNAR